MLVDMIWVDSSNLEQIGYDEAASELHVLFKDGAHYVYHDVPSHLFGELADAASKGSFLNREVKPGYRYTRM